MRLRLADAAVWQTVYERPWLYASAGKGAAEEFESEPDDASSTLAAASYDPTIYQRPHPDDRGGGMNSQGKPRKEGGGEGNDKSKAQGKSKGGKGKAAGRCGNCDAEGATRKCSQCGTEVYCDKNCQRVRGRVSA